MTDAVPDRGTELVHLPRPSALILDKDGTLIDADARWYPYARRYLDVLAAGDPSLKADLDRAFGVGADRLEADGPALTAPGAELRALARSVLGRAAIDGHEIERRLAGAGARARLGDLVPLGSVDRSLARLDAAGFRLGLATTDDRATTVDDLRNLGIARFLDPVTCGDDDGPVKPDPAVVRTMLRAWGLGPDQAWFIGDSSRDADTARAAGIAFVAVTRDGRPTMWAPEAPTITSIDEVTEALVGR